MRGTLQTMAMEMCTKQNLCHCAPYYTLHILRRMWGPHICYRPSELLGIDALKWGRLGVYNKAWVSHTHSTWASYNCTALDRVDTQ